MPGGMGAPWDPGGPGSQHWSRTHHGEAGQVQRAQLAPRPPGGGWPRGGQCAGQSGER